MPEAALPEPAPISSGQDAAYFRSLGAKVVRAGWGAGSCPHRGGETRPHRRISFPVGAQRKPLVLIAERKGGGDAGPVTCTITVDGKLLASTTADGQYAAPECSGSG